MTNIRTENASVQSTATAAGEEDNTSKATVGVRPVSAARDGSGQPRSQGRWWLKSLVNTGLFVAAGLLLIVGLGIAQRIGWISAGGATGGAPVGGERAGAANVRYICPMMCTPPQSEPGRCPVCAMELVPASDGGGEKDDRSLEISPAARRVANIATEAVHTATLERAIRTVGKIAFDESRQATISAYVCGRIEKLFADYTGVYVAEGDHMVVLYSPDLYAAQVEYLVSRKSIRSASSSANQSAFAATQQRLVQNSREKLRELGMTDAQVAALERSNAAETRLKICAPIGGTVIEKLKQEGQYVKAGEAIYCIADLSVVWLMLELFPEDASQVRYGQKVEAVVQSLPGEVFTGRVAFIDPVVDEKTRTVSVRVEVLNHDLRLRPGDYAAATVNVPLAIRGNVYDPELAGRWISPRHPQIFRDEPGRCPLCNEELIPTSQLGYSPQPVQEQTAVVVPRDAVLMAGGDSVVYVEAEPGRFEIRRVVLGPSCGDKIAILAGVQDGERVARSGNFLIDSQMQLAGNPSLIDPTKAKSRPEPAEDGASAEVIAALSKLSPANRALVEKQKVCPVTGLPLGSMGTPIKVDVNGRTVFICCEGCRKRLLAEPSKHLTKTAQGVL